MSAPELDVQALRRWVGNTQTVTQRLDPFAAQALAALLDLDDVPQAGDPLPLPWHWVYFLEATRRAETGPDGHPRRGGFLPPVPLPRRMWAAGAFEVAAPLILGDEATRTSTVQAVEFKSGRQGPLLFVTVEHRMAQHGRTCIIETQDLVYREAPSGPAPLPPGEPAPAAAAWRRELGTDAVLLFRFSALTYNGHRIHYDHDYAVHEEFYPGLVVHGPLQALLLADMACRGRPLARLKTFRFRAVRPLFVPQTLGLAGSPSDGQAQLWSYGPDGCVRMRAEASWEDPPGAQGTAGGTR